MRTGHRTTGRFWSRRRASAAGRAASVQRLCVCGVEIQTPKSTKNELDRSSMSSPSPLGGRSTMDLHVPIRISPSQTPSAKRRSRRTWMPCKVWWRSRAERDAADPACNSEDQPPPAAKKKSVQELMRSYYGETPLSYACGHVRFRMPRLHATDRQALSASANVQMAGLRQR